jgi:hypothetical protein
MIAIAISPLAISWSYFQLSHWRRLILRHFHYACCYYAITPHYFRHAAISQLFRAIIIIVAITLFIYYCHCYATLAIDGIIATLLLIDAIMLCHYCHYYYYCLFFATPHYCSLTLLLLLPRHITSHWLLFHIVYWCHIIYAIAITLLFIIFRRLFAIIFIDIFIIYFITFIILHCLFHY